MVLREGQFDRAGLALLRCSQALVILFLGLSCIQAEDRVMVFAASSLTDALQQVGPAFEEQTGGKPVFNVAGSSTLARQIEAGAPADVFISADAAQMDLVEKRGLVAAGTRQDLLSNTLVVVTPTDGPKLSQLTDLTAPSVSRIALGNPSTVPAGVYARQLLETHGLWKEIQPKVVPCESVRSALAVVAMGNADAAIVYATDAARSDRVKVAISIPAAEGPTIQYPVAVLKDSRRPEMAKQFVDFLGSDSAQGVFKNHGFRLPPKE